MRAIALISALAMLAAVFLPWVGVAAFQGHATPWGLISATAPDLAAWRGFVTSHPLEMLAILATLVLAALFILAAALGYPSRLLAIVAGGIVLGLIGYGLWQIRQGGFDAGSLGLAIRQDSALSTMLQSALAGLRPGAWLWGAGGLFLALSGAIGYGDRR